MKRSLFLEKICTFAEKYPENLAVWANKETLSYATLLRFSKNLASLLKTASFAPSQTSCRLGIFGDRSLAIPVAVVGAAWAGICYIPFSLKAPSARLLQQFQMTRCSAFFIDRLGTQYLTAELLDALPDLLIAGDKYTQDFLREKGKISHLFSEISEALPAYHQPVPYQPQEDAYIIFTSGSTGMPKGVQVPFLARDTYFEEILTLYEITPNDRVAQPFDLAWDSSIKNMGFALCFGAALFYLNERQVLAPSAFIRKNQISIWGSSPSIVDLMYRREALKENIFPSLRYSVFLGSPLHASAAEAWQKAAPNTRIFNTYGPTEFTVDCTFYEIPKAFEGKNIPIGWAFKKTHYRLEALTQEPTAEEKVGELWLSGDQLATGYLDDPERTAEAFPFFEGKRWYRTGDLVSEDQEGLLYFKGRLNNQIKVLGYRVEIEEVESRLREVSGIPSIAVCGYPPEKSAVEYLLAFVVADKINVDEIKKALSEILPSYMIPDQILKIDAIPENSTGKIDRTALKKLASEISRKA